MKKDSQQIAVDIISYVQKRSVLSEQNSQCYIHTGEIKNPIHQEQVVDFTQAMHHITTELAKQIEAAYKHEQPAVYDCGMWFQYIFDRSVEVAYQYIIGAEKIKTHFNLNEVNDYYEPDLPEYLQLKVTNAVSHIAMLFNYTYTYIVDNKYNEESLQTWLAPLLYAAAITAFTFTIGIDMDDDSEMQQYLHND